MDVGKPNSLFLLLLFCSLLPARFAYAQQRTEGPDAQLVIDRVAADVKFRATLDISSALTLAQLHALARRIRLREFGFSVRAPDIPQMGSTGGTSGEGPGQSDEAWSRTLCRLRISLRRSYGRDVSDSGLQVINLSPLASARSIRELQRELGGAGRLTSVVQLTEQDYEDGRQQSAGSQNLPAGAFPTDFALPPGCEAHVHRVVGWRTSDLDTSARRTQKEILQDVAAANPDQPVSMELHVGAPASLRDVAGLAMAHAVASLSGALYPAVARTPSNGGIVSLEFDFSSRGGPVLEQQLAQTECRLRNRFQSQDSAFVFVDWRSGAGGILFVKLKAKDALALISRPPDWLGMTGYPQFEPPGALEMAQQAIARQFRRTCPAPSPGSGRAP